MRSPFWPRGFPPADSATPPHLLTSISNHNHTPSQPQLMLDQKRPLQHLLAQQPQPSHCRAAAPLAPAAAPPPPPHVDHHQSPSCCHPTTHLRQAKACLELPTTVQQPLLQRPPSCLHPPSLHSATKLVSCDEQYLGIEGDSKLMNQVALRLNEMKLVDEEVRAIEVNRIDEDDGLQNSCIIAAFDIHGCLAKTSLKGMNADTWSLVSPSILERMEFRCLVDEHIDGFEIKKQDIQLDMEVKQRLFEDEFKLNSNDLGKAVGAHTLQTLGVYVDLNVIDITSMNPQLPSLDADATILAWNSEDHISRPLLIFYGGEEGRRLAVRYTFDSGGDKSPKLLLSTLFVASWFPP